MYVFCKAVIISVNNTETKFTLSPHFTSGSINANRYDVWEPYKGDPYGPDNTDLFRPFQSMKRHFQRSIILTFSHHSIQKDNVY